MSTSAAASTLLSTMAPCGALAYSRVFLECTRGKGDTLVLDHDLAVLRLAHEHVLTGHRTSSIGRLKQVQHAGPGALAQRNP
jgi:hypothetical protein